MIKTFKDFDGELKGQKIYEAIDEDIQDTNKKKFTEDDIIVPELISSNKFLLKISKIVLKRLDASGLGQFGVQPNIITIDGAPGVYFFNYNDETMNIVICRNTMGKHVYLFKKFNTIGENVADLVLSTKTLGFGDIIDEMIAYLSSTPNSIDEAWKANIYAVNTGDEDVDKILKMGATTRQLFADVVSTYGIAKGADNIMAAKDSDKNCMLMCDEAVNAFKVKLTRGLMLRVCVIFAVALEKFTKNVPLDAIKDSKRVLNGITIKTSTSPISTASNVSAVIDDETQKELDAKYQAELLEDIEEYQNSLKGIYKTTCAMCSYVKNDGEVNDKERGWLETRCLLVTGTAGVGKSMNVEKALKDMGMIENKDYLNVSSGSTAMASLYKKFYDYNGKLLILDDSSSLFKTEYQKSFWKSAFQSKKDISEPCLVALPVVETKNIKKNDSAPTYDPTQLTRQERYFREIGSIAPDERRKWEKQRRPEIRQNSQVSISETDMRELLDQEWAEIVDQKSPSMPTRFGYNGVVIIISNETYEQSAKIYGAGHWGAIVSRMTNYDLHPKTESIWFKIRKDIEEQRDKSEEELPSKLCLVPRELADEFIEEVERLIKINEYCHMTYRLVAINMNTCMNGEETRAGWKSRLKQLMKMGRKAEDK
jgi:hypothetical protein